MIERVLLFLGKYSCRYLRCLSPGGQLVGVARAGRTAIALDQFADLDFPPSAQVYREPQLSIAHWEALNIPRPAPLLLCGGAEHRLEDLQSLAAYCHFWTSDPKAIHQARDPLFLRQMFLKHGLTSLPIRYGTWLETLPENHCWIRKPVRSIGGIGVERLPINDSSLPTDEQYDQQFQAGRVCSAQFLSWQPAGTVRLAGCTEQIIGSTALPDRPFGYAGNRFPLECSASEQPLMMAQLQRLGEVLTHSCKLQGLWGLDFVWQAGIVYPLEINPRYTAAMELLELAEHRSLLEEWLNPDQDGSAVEAGVSVKKEIFYAPCSFRLPVEWDWQELNEQEHSETEGSAMWQIPRYSDLPAGGTDFRPGEPVCTIWGAGSDRQSCDLKFTNHFQELAARIKTLASI